VSLIRLAEAAKHFKGETHQLAALNWLDEQIPAKTRAEFTELYRAAVPSKPPAKPPAATAEAMAMAFLQSPGIEGLELEAYPDPETGGAPWTIGYGNTRMDGKPVRKGDRITREKAVQMLAETVKSIALALTIDVPGYSGFAQEMQAALISFAFNNGTGFMDSGRHQTIAAALDGARLADVPAAMMLYVNPGGPTEAGLRKRRRLEGEMWNRGLASMKTLPPAPAAPRPAIDAGGLKLDPEPQYYPQTDNGSQRDRTCFTSSVAMLAKQVKPDSLSGSNADFEQFLKVVNKFGDTTNPEAQVRALAVLGIKAKMSTACNWSTVEAAIKAGHGIPLGYIHRGPVTAPDPRSLGHWLYCWGINATHILVHDPQGEPDMLGGGFVPGKSGRSVMLTRRNFERRWMVTLTGGRWAFTPGTGWGVLVQP
jgi:GH24 family phage-related lysozyme (muramidase)